MKERRNVKKMNERQKYQGFKIPSFMTWNILVGILAQQSLSPQYLLLLGFDVNVYNIFINVDMLTFVQNKLYSNIILDHFTCSSGRI